MVVPRKVNCKIHKGTVEPNTIDIMMLCSVQSGHKDRVIEKIIVCVCAYGYLFEETKSVLGTCRNFLLEVCCSVCRNYGMHMSSICTIYLRKMMFLVQILDQKKCTDALLRNKY